MARIVLCDDSNVILTALTKKMSDLGHEIVAKAKDGNEGVAAYEKQKPDLVLLDVTMPNKDGRECLNEILNLNPKAKVIMISALQDEAVINECVTRGAKGFISKNKLFDGDHFNNEVAPLIEKILKAA